MGKVKMGTGIAVRGAWLLAALVAALLDVERIEATTTFTAPLRNSEGNPISCAVQNHSSHDVAVSAVLRDGSGADLEGNALMVGAGDLTALLFNDDSVGNAYCRFIFDGDDAAIRGVLSLYDAATGSTSLLVDSSEVRGVTQPGVVVYSPPVVSGPSDLVGCVAHNIGTAAVSVTARLRSSNAVLLDEMTDHVAAGEVSTIVSAADPLINAYCEFSFDGNPSALRGYVRIGDDMGGNTRFLAVASAGVVPTGTVYTPPIAPHGGTVYCIAHNLDDEVALVDADLLDADGAVISSVPAAPVEPGDVVFLTNTLGDSTTPVSCRFAFGARVRGFIAFLEPGGTQVRLIHPATANGGNAGVNATSFTPALRAFNGGEIECWAHNVGATDIFVTATLVNPMGATVDSHSMLLGAGHARRLVHGANLLDTHCRFLFNGSPGDIRGYIVLDDGSPRLLHAASIAAPLTPPPTPTKTVTATRTRTATATRTPNATATATRTPNATVTRTTTAPPSATATHTSTAPPGATATHTSTAPPSATATHTSTAPPSATATRTSTAPPSATVTRTSTVTSATHTATVTAIADSPTPTSTPSVTATQTANATQSATATADTEPSPTPSPPPTATATAVATATTSPDLPGDANCDGMISAADLVAVSIAIGAGAGTGRGCGEDANQDGTLDAADRVRIITLIFTR